MREKTPLTNLHVFWINLRERPVRRAAMIALLTSLGASHTRIEAVGKDEVAHLLASHALHLLDGISMGIPSARSPVRRRDGVFSSAEVGCTLSHLRAIDAAWRMGVDQALVMEDDVSNASLLYTQADTDLPCSPAVPA